jgi:hypothetical protein
MVGAPCSSNGLTRKSPVLSSKRTKRVDEQAQLSACAASLEKQPARLPRRTAQVVKQSTVRSSNRHVPVAKRQSNSCEYQPRAEMHKTGHTGCIPTFAGRLFAAWPPARPACGCPSHRQTRTVRCSACTSRHQACECMRLFGLNAINASTPVEVVAISAKGCRGRRVVKHRHNHAMLAEPRQAAVPSDRVV